jgi:hypothetical protein
MSIDPKQFLHSRRLVLINGIFYLSCHIIINIYCLNLFKKNTITILAGPLILPYFPYRKGHLFGAQKQLIFYKLATFQKLQKIYNPVVVSHSLGNIWTLCNLNVKQKMPLSYV